ncbi:response regulator [Thiocystis violascens]|uniref:Response regulator with CheY-like receiver domain and winged-helix DNA-binding domain n=1 Tax=Thiocystis violascens (strain ATCC 17096 / DSM 198 / 6111) TaxID=765911 RepID=I3YGZ3_THIV6|nr:response regulator [Thiocystis violascens]AFL76261.1 response regulator with CheY-like receiver domain and winged-helix DNA-binding domain [Thiocystis violascens DSM 198]
MRILIVEDDRLLGAGLQTGLAQDGYLADWVHSADPAEHALRVEHFDVMVLDLGLPGRDGLTLLRDLRRQGIDLPILILTARDAIADKVAGLDAGADDYLVKPFDLDELSARIRALARRREGHATPLLQAGALALDTNRRTVTLGEQPLSLSPKEYALLEKLVANADQVVPRARLAAATYGWRDEIESNAMEVHIHNLRQKLGKHRILTVRGVGYQFVSEPSP